jgi:hypothetical protein
VTKKTVYTIHNSDGTSLELSLDGDTLTIRSLWANDEVRGELEIEPTVKFMSELSEVVNEIWSEVIGE